MISPRRFSSSEKNNGITRFVASWSLWQVGRPALAFIVSIDLLAALLMVGTPVVMAATPGRGEIPAHSWGELALLFGLAAVYGEACERVERLRRFLAADGAISNHYSVLCFAGVLTLPASLAALLVVAVYGHELIRTQLTRSARAYRVIFTAAAALIATLAAAAVYHSGHGQLDHIGPVTALLIVAALIVQLVVNLAVLAPGMYLVVRPVSIRNVLPSAQDIAYELATLVLGVLAAIMLRHGAWLSPLILVVIAVWHRASLVTQLQHSAQHDGKTGLLHASAWRDHAATQLLAAARARRPISLLVIDLDRFKTINDTFGHLAGDQALQAVADVLRNELRACDSIGRYGGEEFAALLPEVGRRSAAVVAERIRARVATIESVVGMRVTASIGVATATPGQSLDSLIEAADSAMYAAKAAGRNRVHVHESVTPAVAEPPSPAGSLVGSLPDSSEPGVPEFGPHELEVAEVAGAAPDGARSTGARPDDGRPDSAAGARCEPGAAAVGTGVLAAGGLSRTD
jgi:diguanylate cyclase (GGDEF)-like protein